MNKKAVIGIVLMLIAIGMFAGCTEKKSSDNQIDISWFKGTWLNHINYDNATIELFFLNVFDDAVIFSREKGETNWSKTEVSDFAVFYSKERHNNYKNYVLYLELPLDSNIYLCSVWSDTNDWFEIYYGDNEHMRFYKVG